MSTLATADLNSDSEGDEDFTPLAPKPKKNESSKRKRSSSTDSDSSNTEDVKVDQAEAAELKEEQRKADEEKRRAKAAAEFASLQNGSEAHKSAELGCKAQEKERVEIKRARIFAGETIYETVSLPRDDPEVIAYLAKPSNNNGDAIANIATPTPSKEQISSAADGSNSMTAKLPKGPPKRKPRQSLEAMSAALGKGKKMTTLEKSQMDWKNHLSSSTTISDELASNRKSGGYLEKRDFLDRVGDRKSQAFDGHKR